MQGKDSIIMRVDEAAALYRLLAAYCPGFVEGLRERAIGQYKPANVALDDLEEADRQENK